jgi:nitrous oxide reductase accessory protein NosL
VKTVPLDLVYVADMSKAKAARDENPNAEIWCAAEAGFISQNVYLFACLGIHAAGFRDSAGRTPNHKAAAIIEWTESRAGNLQFFHGDAAIYHVC